MDLRRRGRAAISAGPVCAYSADNLGRPVTDESEEPEYRLAMAGGASRVPAVGWVPARGPGAGEARGKLVAAVEAKADREGVDRVTKDGEGEASDDCEGCAVETRRGGETEDGECPIRIRPLNMAKKSQSPAQHIPG